MPFYSCCNHNPACRLPSVKQVLIEFPLSFNIQPRACEYSCSDDFFSSLFRKDAMKKEYSKFNITNLNKYHPVDIKLIYSLIVFGLFLLGLAHSSLQASEPYPGYTMFSMGRTAYLYNMKKEKVHQWEVSEGSIQTSPYLLPDGSVLFPLNKGGFTFRPGGAHPSGTFQKISWEGKVLWDFSFYGDDFTPSYDVEPMPNGNILLCAGFKDRRRPGKLFEIQPIGKNGGKVVWECNVSEKIGDLVQGYINSVSYNPTLDQVLVNIQFPGRTMAIFDHSNSKANLLYKWNQGFSGRLHGGCWVTDRYLGTNTQIPDADKELMRVGNIITVSNGDNEAVEVNPRTNKRIKSFKYEFSDHQGNVQRLPNGNTLIVSGYSKQINELDDNGKIVWSMETSGRISRAYRYGLKYEGILNEN